MSPVSREDFILTDSANPIVARAGIYSAIHPEGGVVRACGPGGQNGERRTPHKATRLTIAHFWLGFVQVWLSFVIAPKQSIVVDALVRPCLMAMFADSTLCVEDIPSVWAPECTCDAHFSYRLQKKTKTTGYNQYRLVIRRVGHGMLVLLYKQAIGERHCCLPSRQVQ